MKSRSLRSFRQLVYVCRRPVLLAKKNGGEERSFLQNLIASKKLANSSHNQRVFSLCEPSKASHTPPARKWGGRHKTTKKCFLGHILAPTLTLYWKTTSKLMMTPYADESTSATVQYIQYDDPASDRSEAWSMSTYVAMRNLSIPQQQRCNRIQSSAHWITSLECGNINCSISTTKDRRIY